MSITSPIKRQYGPKIYSTNVDCCTNGLRQFRTKTKCSDCFLLYCLAVVAMELMSAGSDSDVSEEGGTYKTSTSTVLYYAVRADHY